MDGGLAKWKGDGFETTIALAKKKVLIVTLLKLLPIKLNGYNPGKNFLSKFSPSCPLSYGTKLFPKRRLCGKKTPNPQYNVASHKRPGIRLPFEYTTLLSGEGGKGRTGTATMFRKMLSKYTIFSTVLSKIVALLPGILSRFTLFEIITDCYAP